MILIPIAHDRHQLILCAFLSLSRGVKPLLIVIFATAVH